MKGRGPVWRRRSSAIEPGCLRRVTGERGWHLYETSDVTERGGGVPQGKGRSWYCKWEIYTMCVIYTNNIHTYATYRYMRYIQTIFIHTLHTDTCVIYKLYPYIRYIEIHNIYLLRSIQFQNTYIRYIFYIIYTLVYTQTHTIYLLHYT